MLSVRMSKSIVFLSLASAIALLCCALNAQQSTKPDPRHKEMARALRKSANRTTSLEVFGHSIAQHALLEASKQIELGHSGPFSVNLQLQLRATALPSVPSPDEIDVCWEICPMGNEPFWQCYVNCSARGLEPPLLLPIDPRTCEDIWRDYKEAANLLLKIRYLQELLANECLEPRAVQIQIRRPFNR